MSIIGGIEDQSGHVTPTSAEVEDLLGFAGRNTRRSRYVNRSTCCETIRPRPIKFGKATPWKNKNVNNHHRRTIFQCLTVIVLMGVFRSLYFSENNAKFHMQTISLPNHPVPELLPCECSNEILETKFGINFDYQIFSLLEYNELNIEDTILIEPVDNSTCLLNDIFSRISTTLCCLKDIFISTIRIEKDDEI